MDYGKHRPPPTSRLHASGALGSVPHNVARGKPSVFNADQLKGAADYSVVNKGSTSRVQEGVGVSHGGSRRRLGAQPTFENIEGTDRRQPLAGNLRGTAMTGIGLDVEGARKRMAARKRPQQKDATFTTPSHEQLSTPAPPSSYRPASTHQDASHQTDHTRSKKEQEPMKEVQSQQVPRHLHRVRLDSASMNGSADRVGIHEATPHKSYLSTSPLVSDGSHAISLSENQQRLQKRRAERQQQEEQKRGGSTTIKTKFGQTSGGSYMDASVSQGKENRRNHTMSTQATPATQQKDPQQPLRKGLAVLDANSMTHQTPQPRTAIQSSAAFSMQSASARSRYMISRAQKPPQGESTAKAVDNSTDRVRGTAPTEVKLLVGTNTANKLPSQTAAGNGFVEANFTSRKQAAGGQSARRHPREGARFLEDRVPSDKNLLGRPRQDSFPTPTITPSFLSSRKPPGSVVNADVRALHDNTSNTVATGTMPGDRASAAETPVRKPPRTPDRSRLLASRNEANVVPLHSTTTPSRQIRKDSPATPASAAAKALASHVVRASLRKVQNSASAGTSQLLPSDRAEKTDGNDVLSNRRLEDRFRREHAADRVDPTLSRNGERNLDAEFSHFMKDLKRETASEHKQLWTKFQSLRGCPPTEIQPLYASDDEQELNEALNSIAPGRRRKAKNRMDPETQRQLDLVCKRTTSKSSDEDRGGPQLVNDTQYVRNLARSPSLRTTAIQSDRGTEHSHSLRRTPATRRNGKYLVDATRTPSDREPTSLPLTAATAGKSIPREHPNGGRRRSTEAPKLTANGTTHPSTGNSSLVDETNTRMINSVRSNLKPIGTRQSMSPQYHEKISPGVKRGSDAFSFSATTRKKPKVTEPSSTSETTESELLRTFRNRKAQQIENDEEGYESIIHQQRQMPGFSEASMSPLRDRPAPDVRQPMKSAQEGRNTLPPLSHKQTKNPESKVVSPQPLATPVDKSEAIRHVNRSGPHWKTPEKQQTWLETLKKQQRQLREQQKHQQQQPNTTAIDANTTAIDGDDGSGTIFGARLKRVQTPATVPPRDEVPSSQTENSGKPPWAVKLKSVSRRKSGEGMGPGPSESSHPPSVEKKPPPSTLKKPPKINVSKHPAVSSLSSQRDSSKDTALKVGMAVNLRALPKPAFSEEEDVTVVRLSDDGRGESMVVVGQTALLTVKNCESRPYRQHNGEDGEHKAEILWWSSRSEIPSLTLNAAASGAQLTTSTGASVSLQFGGPEDCFQFAQAFYGFRSSSNGLFFSPRDGTAGTSRSSTHATHTARALTDDTSVGSSAVLTVSEEDQKILEKYHSLRSQQPPTNRDKGGGGLDEGIIAQIIEEEGGTNPAASKRPAVSEDSDEDILKKYRLMLKMQTPADAVRHRMHLEEVDQRLIAKLFGGEMPNDAAKPSPALSKEDEGLAEKYRKMTKMGVPEEGVRHKMARDNVNQRVVDAVFPSDTDRTSPSTDGPQTGDRHIELTGKEEEAARKYRKMLKLSIPEDAVRHAMKKDGVGERVVLAVLGPDPNARPDVSSSKVQSHSTLKPEEEKVASTYRKMLKMSIPPDAVRHKMARDGVDEKIVEAVLGASGDAQEKKPNDPGRGGANRSASSRPEKQKERRRRNGAKSLVALHWTPLDPEAVQKSVFAKKSTSAGVKPEASDISKLEELFQKKASVSNKSVASSENSIISGGGDMTRIVDLNRANNIAISLNSFKEFSYQELVNTLDDLDPEGRIQGERLQHLGSLLPSPTEVKGIREYSGDDSKLVPAEKFFRRLQKAKRIEEKIHAIKTMGVFTETVGQTQESLVLLRNVCYQVMESRKLQKVLATVLDIGNIMNEGTRTGEIEGFKIDSLLKLTQTKSMDGSVTVLDFIVMTFRAKKEQTVLQLSSEFPDCQLASRMLLGDLVNEVNSAKSGLERCRAELKKMKNDQSGGEDNSSAARKKAPIAGDRSALFASITSRRSNEDDESDTSSILSALKNRRGSGTSGSAPLDPRNALLGSIQALGKPGASEKPPSKKNVVYSAGVKRLETFLQGATDTVLNLERDKSDCIQACKDLAVYFGEAGEASAAASVLSVLSEFVANVEGAVEKQRKAEEDQARKEATAKKKKQEEQKRTKTPRKKRFSTPRRKKTVQTPSSRGKDSLVLMVNDMLSTSSVAERTDFTRGVTNEDSANQKLLAVYAAEQHRIN